MQPILETMAVEACKAMAPDMATVAKNVVKAAGFAYQIWTGTPGNNAIGDDVAKVGVTVLATAAEGVMEGVAPELVKLGAKVGGVWLTAAAGFAATVICPAAAPVVATACAGAITTLMAV